MMGASMRRVGLTLALAIIVLVVLLWAGRRSGPEPEEAAPAPSADEGASGEASLVGGGLEAMPGRVEGHIYDSSGQPVAGAAVILRTADAPEPKPALDQTLSDESGFYACTAERGGRCMVRAEADGFAPQEQPVEFRDASPLTVDFRLVRLARIEGQVVAEGGVDTTRVKVCYRGQNETSGEGMVDLDAYGRFAWGLAPGDYALHMAPNAVKSSDGEMPGTLPYAQLAFAVRRGDPGPHELLPDDELVHQHPLHLEEGEEVDDLVIVLANRRNHVGGRVITNTGEPVAGATMLLRAGGTWLGKALSAKNGGFSIDHIPLDEDPGDIVLAVSGTPNARDRYPNPLPVALGQADVLVRIEREYEIIEHELSGQVVDRKTGKGLRGAELAHPSEWRVKPIVAGRNGRFEVTVTGVVGQEKPSRHCWRVSAEGYVTRNVVLDFDPEHPPEERILLALDRADSELTITFHLPEGITEKEVKGLSAELIPAGFEVDQALPTIPVVSHELSRGEHTFTAPLRFSQAVSPGSYQLYTNAYYLKTLEGEGGGAEGMPTYWSFNDISFLEVSVAQGANACEVHLGGNATLAIRMPNVPIKEITGRLWHSAELVEADSAFGRLFANNGNTQFSFFGPVGAGQRILVPALPSGSYALDMFLLPEKGERRREHLLVNLRGGATSPIAISMP